MSVHREDLSGAWTLELTSGPVPGDAAVASARGIDGCVPGAVHTDLLAAGLIPDPYVDTHEDDVAWVSETATRYRRTFDATGLLGADHERVDLVAEGLDTVATVTLNGAVVGRTRNQHRSYRFDVGALLVPGANELVVDLEAPLPAARASQERIGARPLVGDALPYNALRKMASNFGWDWGPTLTTTGIWRPIGLQAWSTARLAGVVPRTTVGEDGRGSVALHVDLERTAGAEVTLDVELCAPDGVVVATTSASTREASLVLSVGVDAPELWWPRGHGDQPLYGVSVRLRDSGSGLDDAVLDSWARDVGFRTAQLVMEPDAHSEDGTSFVFRVNGRDLWVKGANWICDDAFPHRVGPERYARGVSDAAEAGMNMLRVWGGGVYEDDAFYDLCDREGILVWQDFAFACACYSEAPELWEEVEAEARENVARLASHPSLVLWNGSNENIEGYHNWGFADRLKAGEAWGGGYYHELLPRVLAEVDPTRAYIPSSPWNPVDDADPTNPDHGPVHSWKVWFTLDYLHYRDAVPRFVAEFGFQGPAAWSTLAAAVHDDPMTPDSPGMAQHQKAIDGNLKLERGWTGHLPEPTTIDDWHFTTQLGQARAITCAVAHFRSHAPRTSGYLVWQLNDCWPAISWAMVDGEGRRKPLWYALRALNAERLLMIAPRGDGLALVVSNDSDQPWRGAVAVRRLRTDGGEVASMPVDVDVPARSTATVALPAALTTPGDAARELLVADAAVSGAARAWWWFVEDVDLDLSAPALGTTVERVDGGYAVTVTARSLVKDLAIFPDRLDPGAVVDDLLVTLLPGEDRTFVVTTGARLDASALTARPVLRSANDLLHPAEEAAP